MTRSIADTVLKAPSKTQNNIDEINGHNRSVTLVYVFIGIILCLVIIIAAMLLVPSSTEKKIITQENIIIEPEIKKRNEENTENKKFNEKIEIDWMLKKTDAEKHRLTIWAKDDYEIALVLEQQADNYKNKKQYKNSENYYKKAIEKIDEIFTKKQQIFNQLVNQGTALLNDEKLQQAELLFIKAQVIDKENKLIIRSLERIDNRNKVNILYDQSIDQEKNDELDEAVKLLEKALIIEPEFIKINKKLTELKEKKLKKYFNKTISEILEALDINDLTVAEKKLNLAKKINSTDPIIEELEIRITEKNINYKIKRLQKIARNQVKNEQWYKAKKTYQKILTLDPDVSSAIVFRERAVAYIYLNKLLNDIILKPERLRNEQVLEKSKKNLLFINNELQKKENIYFSKLKTPDLNKKILSAEKIIKDASRYINVTIKSDNETEIIIYKVEKLGKIIEKVIKLRPGQYTIVGSREGYRDFRKTIKITAADQMVLVNVYCREKI